MEVFGYGENSPAPPAVSTPHPHFDFPRRTFYTYALQLSNSPTYNFYTIDPTSGCRRLLNRLPAPDPAYMHTFAKTPNYLVLTEFPLVLPGPSNLAISGRPFIENFEWQPQRGTGFQVISKRNGRLIASLESEPSFAYHHVNAFERNGELILDLSVYQDPVIINQFYLEKLENPAGETPSRNRLKRFSFSLTKKIVKIETLWDGHIELPRINYEARSGGVYKYVYGVGHRNSTSFFEDRLLKLDLDQGTCLEWFEEGCFVGEPVFVPLPGSAGEDNGVILAVILDPKEERSFLLVLDAKTFTELARAWAPQSIPFGLHGAFFPNEA